MAGYERCKSRLKNNAGMNEEKAADGCGKRIMLSVCFVWTALMM